MGDNQSPYEQYIYNYAMSGGISSFNSADGQSDHQTANNSSNRHYNSQDRGGYSNNNRSSNQNFEKDCHNSNYNNDYKRPKNEQVNPSSSNYDGLQVQRETIFVENLPKTVTVDDLVKHFGSIGIIKQDKKTNQPKIWIYRDKQTGEGKGEATVAYDDEAAASAAIEWFNEKEVMGQIVKVSLATRKTQNVNNSFRGRGGSSGANFRGGKSSGNNFGRNYNDRNERNYNNDRPRGGGYSSNDRDRNRGNDRGPDRTNDRFSRPAPY